MSSQGPSNARETPPHMPSSVAGPTVEGPHNAGGSPPAAFITAPMTSTPPPRPEDTESFSSGEHTSPPNAPSGLKVRVMVDADGTEYVLNPDTGLRFDISFGDSPEMSQLPIEAYAPQTYLHLGCDTGTGAGMVDEFLNTADTATRGKPYP
ncbi:hypothetical protein C8R47DRAFT_1077930 [Mycena vitilis]|nr:hypothetical protein C8R47DRAFT_1077930 [Mycena vitilis]